VPIGVGIFGIILGPEWLRGATPLATDVDSHFRFLSGLFLAVGVSIALCIRDIEEQGVRFSTLGSLIVIGGLARLLSMLGTGIPSKWHLIGLAAELVVMPLLIAWQMRLDRRFRAKKSPRGEEKHPLLGKKRAAS
jgi:hypothetical protein